MTDRELAAYALILMIIAAALIGWRVLASRRRAERRGANWRIDLTGGTRKGDKNQS